MGIKLLTTFSTCLLSLAVVTTTSGQQKYYPNGKENNSEKKKPGGWFTSLQGGPSIGVNSAEQFLPVQSGLLFGAIPNLATIDKTTGDVRTILNNALSGNAINLTGGKNFGKIFGAELGLSYLNGNKTGAIIKGQYNDEMLNQVSEVDLTTFTKTNMLDLRPAISLKPVNEGLVSPYFKLGGIIGLSSKTTTDINGLNQFGDNIAVSGKTNNSANGYFTAAGVNYQATPTVSLFAETAFNSVYMSSSETEITEYTVNGVSKDFFDIVSTTMFDKDGDLIVLNRRDFMGEGNRDGNGSGGGNRKPYNTITVMGGVKFSFDRPNDEEEVESIIRYHRLRTSQSTSISKKIRRRNR